ncbi:hypothetical protein AAF712_010654 [Marasmius tenuissimus]|uniref:Uncharacterized protein n=1 Tax=Marasmius tenuissimus TaxID=585030 RepID=A0ABR2ZPX7_9AGAR
MSATIEATPAEQQILDTLLESLAATRRAQVDQAYHVAEKYQYIESYQYATMMAILGGLSAFVKQDTPSAGYRMLPMQQPTVAPYELSQSYSLKTITNCSPDIALMLCDIVHDNGRRCAGLREIALIIMEMKRLTDGGFNPTGNQEEDEDIVPNQKRDMIPWHELLARTVALEELERTLGQIFSQAICTLASYKSQEILHHFFVCGPYFSVIEFKRPHDFDALLEKYDIHIIRGQEPANTQISRQIMVDFFFNSEQGRPMPTFTVYNERMFELDGDLVKPSVAFRAALKDALDAHGVEFQLDEPFLSLGNSNATHEQRASGSHEGEGLLNQWLSSGLAPRHSGGSSDGDDSTEDPTFERSISSQSSSEESRATIEDIWELEEPEDGEEPASGNNMSRKRERETSADPLEANTSQPDSPFRKNPRTK